MPIYYFSVRQMDGETTDDEIASEFETADLALEQANRALSEMVMDVRPGEGAVQIEIIVRDELGRPVARRSAHFESEDYV